MRSRVDLPFEPTCNSVLSGCIVFILLLNVDDSWLSRFIILISDFDGSCNSFSRLNRSYLRSRYLGSFGGPLDKEFSLVDEATLSNTE